MKKFSLPKNLIYFLIHAAGWVPGLIILFRVWTDQLTADPIQALTLQTGTNALILLMASLSMTPLKNLFGWSWTMTARKWFGVYAFGYALIHLWIYVGLDYGFAWAFLIPEFLQKAYLWVGAAAFLILLVMASTSFRWWMDRLGRGWTYLHRLVYGAGVLVILHFAWVRKGDLFALQGDVLEPLLYGVFFLLLMVLRIPLIRNKLSLWKKTHRKGNTAGSKPVIIRRMRQSGEEVRGE